MESAFQFTFTAQRDEIVEGLRAAMRQNKVFFVFPPVIFIGLTYLCGGIDGHWISGAAFGAASAVLISLFFYVGLPAQTWRRTPEVQGEQVLEFREECVISSVATSTASFEWSLLDRWFETRSTYVIVTKRRAAYVLPKRAVDESLHEPFRRLLDAKLFPHLVDHG